MKLIFTFVALTLIGVVVFDFVRQYRKASSAGWQRVWDAGRGSATIVWQQIGLVVAGLVAASETVVDWICRLVNAPGADEAIKGAISSYVTPVNVSAAMVVFIAITVWARLRTL